MANQVGWKIINGILAGLILVVGLRGYSGLWDLVLGAGVLIGLVLALNFFVLKGTAKVREDYLLSLLPALFLGGLFGTIAATSAFGLKLFLTLAGASLFYFYQLYFPLKPPSFLEDLYSLVGSFLLLILLWSLNFFFTPPWWQINLLTFVIFFLVFWQAFYKMGLAGQRSLLPTLISTLVLVEVSWAILFWPVYFLTAAVVHFSVFYIMYMFSSLHFAKRLTKNKIYFQMALILVLVLLSLLSSPWQPLK